MANARGAVRFRAALRGACRPEDGHELPLMTLNVSTHGLLARTEAPLQPCTRVALRLHLVSRVESSLHLGSPRDTSRGRPCGLLRAAWGPRKPSALPAGPTGEGVATPPPDPHPRCGESLSSSNFQLATPDDAPFTTDAVCLRSNEAPPYEAAFFFLDSDPRERLRHFDFLQDHYPSYG